MPQIPHTGEAAALATAVCWTFTALAFEAAGKRVGSLPVNLARLIIASAFLAAFTAVSRGIPLPVDASGHAWLWLSVSGLVGLFFGDLCLFRALLTVGPRVATLLMSTAPLVAASIGYLVLGETLSLMDLGGMALTVLGVSVVVLERKKKPGGERKGLPAWGVVLGLLGAVGQGAGLVLSKLGMGVDYDPFAATQIRIFAGLAGFAALFTITGRWGLFANALKDRRAMGLTAVGAFFGPFLGVSLSLLSVKHIETGVAQTIMAIVPVLIIPAVIVVHHEKVSARAWIGAVTAVAGVSMLF